MNILFCGDFFPSLRISERIESGDYHFFDSIKPLTEEADYSIVDFEGPVVEGNAVPIQKTGPNLRCTSKAMAAVKYAGFNCVSFANNHFRDFGDNGVNQSINAANKYGLDYMGGGVTLDDARKILYTVIKDEKLAVINVCEHEWSIATVGHGGSNPLDIVDNYHDIQAAKEQAERVIVMIHGGVEHYQLPTPRMQKLYRFFYRCRCRCCDKLPSALFLRMGNLEQ